MAMMIRFQRLKRKNLSIMLLLVLAFQAFFVVSMIPAVYGWVSWKYNTDGTTISVAVSADGNYTVAGTETGSVFLLDGAGGLLWTHHFTVAVECVAISGDGSRIVVGVHEYRGGSPDTYLFDTLGNVMWQKDLVEGSWPCDVAISPDAGYIVTGDTAHVFYFYEISGTQIWTYTAGSWVTAVSVSSEGEYAAAGSWDKTLYFFNRSGSLLWNQTLEYDVDAVSISPEGKYVAAGCSTKDLFLFANNGSLLSTTQCQASIDAVSVSSNAERIAVATYRKINVINETGSFVFERETYDNVEDITITADGSFVAFGCGDYVYFLEVLPPSTITCEISSSEIAFGESITVSGNVSPPRTGAEVTLTYTISNGSSLTRATTMDESGLYNDTFTPDIVGAWEVKASWMGDEQYAGAESPPKSFTVGKTKITCDVPTAVFLEDSVEVNGSIEPPISGIDISLEYRLVFNGSIWKDEGFVNVTRKAVTSVDGSFADIFTPSDLGRWKMNASWAGDAEHMASQTEASFAVNPAAQISLLSVTPVTLYWRREEWCCIDHYFMDMEIPASNESETVAFDPDDYWWLGHGHYEFKATHTGPLSEGILMEQGLWNLSIWAAAYVPDQHFLVKLYCWDKNHNANLIGSWTTEYFNSTSPDTPTEFTHSFNVPARFIPKGSFLGFIVYDCRDSDVKWFFDSALHPSHLTLPPSTEARSYILNIMSAACGNTSPASGIYTHFQGTETAVTANPQAGYSFDHWELDEISVGSTNPVDVLMDKNHTLLAVFIDNIQPQLDHLTQDPSANIQPNQNVTVTATMTDMGSGICNATLGYSIDNGTTWISLNMSKIGGNAYQTRIPEHQNATWVRYKMTSYDNAGNPAVNDNAGSYYVYQVVPEFPTAVSMFLLVFLLTTITIITKCVRAKPCDILRRRRA